MSTDTPPTLSLPRPLLEGGITSALILLAAGVAGGWVHWQARTALKSQIREELSHYATLAAAQVDPALHAQLYRVEQEQSDAYQEISDRLGRILQGTDELTFVYTMRRHGQEIRFVVDPTPPGDTDQDGQDDHAYLGAPYPEVSAAAIAAMETGRVTVDVSPYTDVWGSFMSGYAPIFDPQGRQEGVVGVDMRADRYLERLSYLDQATSIGALALGIAAVAAGWGVYRQRSSYRASMLALEVARMEATQVAARYHVVATFLPDSFMRLDAAGRILDYHAPDGAHLGLNGQSLQSAPFPPSLVEPLLRALQRINSGETVATFECAVPLHVGSHTLEVRVVRAGEERIAFLRDVTERRKIEHERLRFVSLVEESLEFIGMAREGEVFYLNRAGGALLGLPRVEKSYGVRVEHFHSPASLEKMIKEVRPALAVKGRWEGELEFVHAQTKEPIPVACSIFTVYDPATGQLSCTAMVARDLREAKRHDAEMQRAMAEVESAARAKSEFLATMSHEIRTPMNGIIGMTNLLLDTSLTHEQHDYTHTIQASADALLGIINDILDFSKIEAGRLEVEQIPFDLSVAMAEVCELLAPKAVEKGLEVVLEVDPRLPTRVVGDPGRIRQILLNLLGNALKFTERGHIVVRALPVEPATQPPQIRFQVEDTGIGIPAEAQARLFSAFSQADISTTRRFGGTGLGLAICKRLSERMGGRIGITSTPGQGSNFWFQLPLPKVEGEEPVLVDARLLHGVRVLVADDNDIAREVMEGLARRWGMEVETACDGVDALDRLRRGFYAGRPFTLAALDWRMPGLDGEALARAIRKDPCVKNTGLVMVCAAAQRGDARRMEEAGFDGFLVKPVRPDLLRDMLALVMVRRQAGLMGSIITRYTILEAGSGERVPRVLVQGSPPPAPPDVSPEAAPKLRALLAEDNRINQKVAIRLLEKLDCRVDVAANGQEAIDMTARFPYDIVFMDCQMPEVDGFEATIAIRKREAGGARQLIVAMTANAMAGDRERCLDAGMDDYIAKPVRTEELERVLKVCKKRGRAAA